MRLIDRIEEALRPLRVDLTVACVMCGEALNGYQRYGRVGDLCVCCRRIRDMADEVGIRAKGQL